VFTITIRQIPLKVVKSITHSNRGKAKGYPTIKQPNDIFIVLYKRILYVYIAKQKLIKGCFVFDQVKQCCFDDSS